MVDPKILRSMLVVAAPVLALQWLARRQVRQFNQHIDDLSAHVELLQQVLLKNGRLLDRASQNLEMMNDNLHQSAESFAAINRRLEAMALIDSVTGLANHRAMVATLDHELERAQRYNHPFTVLAISIYPATEQASISAAANEAALRSIASVVQSMLRRVDTLGRWIGSDFVAILPESDAEVAVLVAQRLSAVIATGPFPAGGEEWTCAVGLATYPYDAAEREDLVTAAIRSISVPPACDSGIDDLPAAV